MPPNTAAWLTAEKAKPLEVKAADYTSPAADQIVIKNGAVAINPVDWAIQAMGSDLFSWLTYPTVLGSDVAGEVVEVGAAVSRFKVGDRVVGQAMGLLTRNATERAFQTYTALSETMASPIPESLSYESASVLPLCLSTAACGLFMKDYLALQYPTVPRAEPTGKTLLVWGGATSVGSNAIQLAVAAGYEVIATASPKNFDYVRRLGASQAFDYNSDTAVEEIIEALKGKTIVGAFASAVGAPEPCLKVVCKCEGTRVLASAWHVPEKVPEGVAAKFIGETSIKGAGVDKVIYVDFLGKALAAGQYIAAPEPEVVGKGLEYIQVGFDRQRQGVSAKKIVVSL